MAGSLAMSSYSIISTQNKNTIDIEFVVFSFRLIVSILRMKRNITDWRRVNRNVLLRLLLLEYSEIIYFAFYVGFSPIQKRMVYD